MLWRRLTAGRFVRQIKEKLESAGIKLPSLNEMPENVGPESVELLSKLERVIPDEIFPDLARKVFAGKATKVELRSMWETYRPVLAGKTARGKGILPPKINSNDPDQYNSLMEAMSLDSLKSAGPSWSGHLTPQLYHIFIHVTPDGYKMPRGIHLFSAVAMIKPANGDIEYHAFRYPGMGLIMGAPQYECDEADYCDYLWFIVPHRLSTNNLINNLPDYAGLVRLKDGNVEVLKKAVTSDSTGKMREKLVSVLFSRSLKG